MRIKKLKSMPYAQCHVEIVDEHTFYLWSYRTLVCSVEKDVLTVHGLYSATTRRHIGAFMKEYCDLNYQTAKSLYADNVKMDITTGEIFGKEVK